MFLGSEVIERISEKMKIVRLSFRARNWCFSSKRDFVMLLHWRQLRDGTQVPYNHDKYTYPLTARLCMCVYVCVCVRVKERESACESVCVYVCVRAFRAASTYVLGIYLRCDQTSGKTSPVKLLPYGCIRVECFWDSTHCTHLRVHFDVRVCVLYVV